MATPKEQTVIDGYAVFNAADHTNSADWVVTAPLATALADDVVIYNYDQNRNKPIGNNPPGTNKKQVLEELRKIRAAMADGCNLLHTSEVNGNVHTVDETTLKAGSNRPRREVQPSLHQCMDLFKFNNGKISEIHYCAGELYP